MQNPIGEADLEWILLVTVKVLNSYEDGGAVMENLKGIHEECGVFGCFTLNATNLAEIAYYGLYALQHRGQEKLRNCGL